MKKTKDYIKKAQKEKFAIGQFNFSDFTQMKGIIGAAISLNSPVILGTSEGESSFFGLEEAVALRNVLRKKTGLPIFLNLDHGRSFDLVIKAVDAGYDMVHFDGSKLALQDNIKNTKEIVKYARKKGLTVEGEVGRIGTESSRLYSEKFEVKDEDLTDPEQAKEFTEKTKVDLLAVGIGNFHGIEISGVNPNLRIDILERLKEKMPGIAIVLHGGSGVPEDDIKLAIATGVVKININTELRLAFTGNLRRALDSNVEEIVPYKFLVAAKESVQKLVARKIELFSGINKA